MKNSQNNNLFKESLLTSENKNILESIKIQTPEINNQNINNQNIYNQNINNQTNKCDNTNNKDITEIQLKYNKLKKKINLFWNKIE